MARCANPAERPSSNLGGPPCGRCPDQVRCLTRATRQYALRV
jgi:hypothetical protein